MVRLKSRGLTAILAVWVFTPACSSGDEAGGEPGDGWSDDSDEGEAPTADTIDPLEGVDEVDPTAFDENLLPPDNAIGATCALDKRLDDADVPDLDDGEEESWAGFSALGVRGHGVFGRNYVTWSTQSNEHGVQTCMQRCEDLGKNCVACQCHNEGYHFSYSWRGRSYNFSYWLCWPKEPLSAPEEGKDDCGELVSVGNHNIYFKGSYMLAQCGNGEVDEGETCDDGNLVKGDGCDEVCTLEPEYICSTPGAPCRLACVGEEGVLFGTTMNSRYGSSSFRAATDDRQYNVVRFPDGGHVSSISAKLHGATCAGTLSLRRLDADGNPGGPEIESWTIEAGDIDDLSISFEGTRVDGLEVALENPVYVAHNEKLVIGFVATSAGCGWSSAEQSGRVEYWLYQGEQERYINYGAVRPPALTFSGAVAVCKDGATCSAPENVAVCTCPTGLVYEDACVDFCGNGVPTGDEICDDGDDVNGPDGGNACDTNCTPPACGNGVQDPTEGCDDGNVIDGDGCDSDCTIPECGDGTVAPSETCDDGNLTDGDGITDVCDSNCEPTGCGNGITAGEEECDPTDPSIEVACDDNCTFARCGNGFIGDGEVCDDGNTVNGDGCDKNCQPTGCGNTIVTEGEICDDGNLVNGHPEDTSEACTENCAEDTCDRNCTVTACGNGIVTVGEQCDDGNRIDTDGCDNACTRAVCGDGLVTHTEQCDDGNRSGNDGCNWSCKLEPNYVCSTPGQACEISPLCLPEPATVANTGARNSWSSVSSTAQQYSFSFNDDVKLTSLVVVMDRGFSSSDCQSITLTLRRMGSRGPTGTILAEKKFPASSMGSNYRGKAVEMEINPYWSSYNSLRNGLAVGLVVSGKGGCYLKSGGDKPAEFRTLRRWYNGRASDSSIVPWQIVSKGYVFPCTSREHCYADTETEKRCTAW